MHYFNSNEGKMKIKQSSAPSFCNMHPLATKALYHTHFTRSPEDHWLPHTHARLYVEHIQRFENMTNIHDRALRGKMCSLLIHCSSSPRATDYTHCYTRKTYLQYWHITSHMLVCILYERTVSDYVNSIHVLNMHNGNCAFYRWYPL